MLGVPSNMGYIGLDGTPGFTNTDNTMMGRTINYFLTAFADPASAATSNNADNEQMFFGLDFNGFNLYLSPHNVELPVIEHRLRNPPTEDDFEKMALSIYFNGGETALTGAVSSFKITPIELPSMVAPMAPIILGTLINLDNSIHVIWIDIATNEQNIIVERSTIPNNAYEVIATLDANSTDYLDTSPSLETNNCYRLKFSNPAGESAYSNNLCTTTNPASLLIPETPENFLVTSSKTSLSFVLSWEDVSNESYYEIERSIGTVNSFKTIAKLNTGAEAYTDRENLQKNSKYWYRLRATNSAGQSGYTKSQKGMTISNRLLSPLNIKTMVDANGSGARIFWSTNPDILNYRVERSTSINGPFIDISGSLGAGRTMFEDTNLVPGTSYYYHIYAINEFEEIFVKVTVNTPNMPTEPQIAASKAPFNYGGLYTDNGRIGISYSSESVCSSIEFSCLDMLGGNGFFQVLVTPRSYEIGVYNDETSSYIMTIIGNFHLDYYINTTSINSYLPLTTADSLTPFVPMTHSIRKGLPAPLLPTIPYQPFGLLLRDIHLFEGEISGTLISEHNALTDKTTARSPAEPFTINFTYNANVEERIYYRDYPTSTLILSSTLHPAIRSLEISIGDKTWRTNTGYIGLYERIEVTSKFTDYNKMLTKRVLNYFMTAFGDPVSVTIDNDTEKESVFFGIDFNGNSQYFDNVETPVIKHRLRNPPTDDDFSQMALTIYFNGGETALTGVVSSFNITPVELPTTVPPMAPVILSATLTANNSIHIAWVDVASNEQNITVERGNLYGNSYEVVATLAANTTEYQDSSVSAATRYCYRISSSNAAGESAHSDELCKWTGYEPLVSPDTPDDFAVGIYIIPDITRSGNGNIIENEVARIEWSGNREEHGHRNEYGYFYVSDDEIERSTNTYEIERSIDTPDSFELIAKLPDFSLIYDDSNLEKNTVYWYRMRAVSSSGVSSEYTTALSITTAKDLDSVTNSVGR